MFSTCLSHILPSTQVPEVEKEDSVFAQLQALFAQLALSKSTFAHPRAFWQAFKDYDGTPTDVQEHQDAYEFFTRLQVRALMCCALLRCTGG